jgi:hypothetical protein
MNTRDAIAVAVPTVIGAALGAFFGPRGIAAGAALGAAGGAALARHLDNTDREQAPALVPAPGTVPPAPGATPPPIKMGETTWFPTASTWLAISTEASRLGAEGKTAVPKGTIVTATLQNSSAPSSSALDMSIVRATIDFVGPFVPGSSVSTPEYGASVLSIEKTTELSPGITPPVVGQRFTLSPDQIWKVEA